MMSELPAGTKIQIGQSGHIIDKAVGLVLVAKRPLIPSPSGNKYQLAPFEVIGPASHAWHDKTINHRYNPPFDKLVSGKNADYTSQLTDEF